MTPEQKAHKAELQRKRMDDPEYRARKAEYAAEYHSKRCAENPEYLARRAEYQRKQYAENPEVRVRKNEYERNRRKQPECRARMAVYQRKRCYGLTPDQHAAMIEAQGGLCAICRRPGGKKGLGVDHCHETGMVRGLLCDNCNTAIGKLGDTPAGLMRAVKYLRVARKRQQLPLIEAE